MINVCLINYNDADNIIKFIDSIKNYHIVNKIIIVDNYSSDNSLEVLNKIKNSQIHVIASPINAGYGEGINICARYLRSNHIDGMMLVSNSDIIIESENTLVNMYNCFRENRVSVVAPIVIEDNLPYYGFKICTIKEELLMSLPFMAKKYEDKFRKIHEYTKYVDCINGCMFMINPEVLAEINYFDPNLFLYYEENVLGIKLKNAGYKTVVCENAQVIHNHSVTINKSYNAVKKNIILKQSLRYYVKNYLQANAFNMFLLRLENEIFIMGLRIKSLFRK